MQNEHAGSCRSLGGLLLMAAWLMLGIAHAQTVTKVTLVMTDMQGNVLMTKDTEGHILARYTYRPYGVQQSGPTNAGPGYTGHVHDPATGLVYMQQRYYDPAVGWFISPDPVAPAPGNVFSFNRYAYANNNPIRYVDPDGCNRVEAFGGLLYETWQFAHGNGFNGARIVGALKDGYDGEGEGRVHAFVQDATTFIPAGAVEGAALKVAKLIRVAKVAKVLARANKVNHIFSQERHGLNVLSEKFSSADKAYSKIENALKKIVNSKEPGKFEKVVKVGGENVTVRGKVVDGKIKIGTAFIRKDKE
jgi:RHS repeat-associated protein